LKRAITKNRAGGVAQSIGPDFKSQYCQKKKKKMCANVTYLDLSQTIGQLSLSEKAMPGCSNK
jgi:hypothetical protein